MIKKILSAIICVALLVSVIPASLGFAAEDSTVDHYALIDVLTALGIYSETDNMIYGNEPITREELASILSVFYGITEESYQMESSFPDVVEDWTSGHIETVSKKGLLTGYSDGLFRPKANVTLGMFSKILVTMTGYSLFAEAEGGYPDGYMELADELDILYGIDAYNPDALITRAQLTTMLYNALTVPLLERTGFGDDNEFEAKEGVNLLSENFDIYIAEGVVTALPYVTLGYEDATGHVVIDNVSYKTNVDLYDSLGCKARIYYHQTEDEKYGTILYSEPLDSENSVIDVDAEDIASFSGNTFRYYEGSKAKSVTVPTDFILIFNGKRLTNYKMEHVVPPQGKVRLCDIDGDRRYDKIIVDYELDYRVESVTDEEDFTYVSPADGKTALKIGKDDEYSLVVFRKGQKASLKDLKQGDVISIVAEDIDIAKGNVKNTSRVYRIYASDSHVTGTVTAVDSEGIYVDDVFYEPSAAFKAQKANIIPGRIYTLYLNTRGLIAQYKEGATKYSYGILLDFYTSENGLNTENKARILDSNAQIAIYDFTENTKVDGRRKDSFGEFDALFKKTASQCQTLINNDLTSPMTFPTNYWQVVKYQAAEDGTIIALDTVADNLVPSEADLRYHASTDAMYTWGSPVMAVNASSTNHVDNKQERYTLGDSAVFLAMEKNPTKDEHYATYSLSKMGTNEYAAGNKNNRTVILFDADDMNICNFVIVAREGLLTGVSSNETSNIMVYEGIRQKKHTDGEIYSCIVGTNINTGDRVSIPVEDASVVGVAQPGDFLSWTLRADGIAGAVGLVLVRADTKAASHTSSYYWSGRWGGPIRISYARVEAKNDTHVMFRYDDEHGGFDLSNNEVVDGVVQNTFTETIKFSTSAKFWIFDTQNNVTIPATKDDLRDWQNFGDDADMIAGKFSNATMQSIVIYR